MNKSLITLAVLGILVVSMSGVFAITETFNQGTEVTISEQSFDIVITPTTLNFGSVNPGTTANATGNINITVNSGNTDIRVEVTDILNTVGDLFDGIMARNAGSSDAFISILNRNVTFDCELSGTPAVCTYPASPALWESQLPVPSGTPAGMQTGTIVYTIMGPPPS